MQTEKESVTFLGLFEKQKAIIVGIVTVVAAFFWGVIIPIQRIQLQLADIQSRLEDNKKTLSEIVQKNIDQDRRIDRNTQGIEQLNDK